MSTNSEIYLIGLVILLFLVIVFLFIRKISNSNELKVNIEDIDISDTFDPVSDINNHQNFNYKNNQNKQELAILNLISVDRSLYDIEQMFGFISNRGGIFINQYFSFTNKNGIERFRILNALNPGTFENTTKTFAIVIVTDLILTDDPLKTIKQMIEFSLSFTEKFHATLCDQDRTPITKQMISHMESKAQDVERLKQLNNYSN
ncbi:MAG: cell division protein ZipA [Gammaproteobacteria bacterium]|nr:cell division protein ZipA [Gammaproteobacteria bacterium]